MQEILSVYGPASNNAYRINNWFILKRFCVPNMSPYRPIYVLYLRYYKALVSATLHFSGYSIVHHGINLHDGEYRVITNERIASIFSSILIPRKMCLLA